MSEESLVAEREDSSSFWSGTGLGEDISDLSGAISDGSWTQGALAGAGLAGDVVSLAFNPLATAIGAVTGWILEHVHPFPEILDKLAGDADAVRAGSQTWVNISDHLKEQAQDLRNAIKRDMEGQVGQAADAWRSEGADLAAALESLGDLAHSVSTGLGIAGFIVQFVHDMVRDTISEAIGMFCQSVLEEVFSLGLGTPAVVAQISTWVAEKMEVVGRHVDDLISSFEALSKLLRKIEPVTRRLKAFLGHLASAREAPNRFAVRAGHRVGQRINRRLGRSPRSAGSARAAASTSRSAAHASASHDTADASAGHDTGGHTSSGHADTSTGHGAGGHAGHGGESTVVSRLAAVTVVSRPAAGTAVSRPVVSRPGRVPRARALAVIVGSAPKAGKPNRARPPVAVVTRARRPGRVRGLIMVWIRSRAPFQQWREHRPTPRRLVLVRA